MTPEERAREIVGLLYEGGSATPAHVDKLCTIISGHVKAALKCQRIDIGERIRMSVLPNKEDVTKVVFPTSTPPVKKEWVDMSKDAK